MLVTEPVEDAGMKEAGCVQDGELIAIFTIPGRPVPAARMTKRGKYIKPAAQRYLAFKDCVGWAARLAMHRTPPLEGAVGVEIWAYLSEQHRPGDTDNIAKAILDGMNKIVFLDDSQVVDLVVHRRKGMPQRTEVKVWTV